MTTHAGRWNPEEKHHFQTPFPKQQQLVPSVAAPHREPAQRREGLRERCCVSQPDQEINRNKLEQHRQQQRLHCTPGRAGGLCSPQPGPACVRVTHSCCRTWRALNVLEHVGSKQRRAGPARHHGLRMHPQAHRAPAMQAHDPGGERLAAAWSHHMPRLWGTPELKDKQAEGKAGSGQHGTGGQKREGSRTGQSGKKLRVG